MVCHQQALKFCHCLVNFQPILDCFIPNFKLKYENSENIKADRVNKVIVNLHQIKQTRGTFWGTPGISQRANQSAKDTQ